MFKRKKNPPGEKAFQWLEERGDKLVRKNGGRRVTSLRKKKKGVFFGERIEGGKNFGPRGKKKRLQRPRVGLKKGEGWGGGSEKNLIIYHNPAARGGHKEKKGEIREGRKIQEGGGKRRANRKEKKKKGPYQRGICPYFRRVPWGKKKKKEK